jgi:hypothetical protein
VTPDAALKLVSEVFFVIGGFGFLLHMHPLLWSFRNYWPIGLKRSSLFILLAEVFMLARNVYRHDTPWIVLSVVAVVFWTYIYLRLSDDEDDIDRWKRKAREKAKVVFKSFAPSPIPAPVAQRSC